MKEDGKSEFWKWAEQNGLIKDVSEAFEEYPVEEEWHKGKVENILKEDVAQYGSYEIGDIIFVEKFNYSNGHRGEKHFFVIIDKDNSAIPIENLGMLISSKTEKLKYKENHLLKKDAQNKLDKDSIVKTDVIYRILHNQVLFKLGSVDMEKVEEYRKAYYNNESSIEIY